jgi:flagellar assembly factor FliW
MIINTTHFGPLAIDESSAVEFPQGLPGFEECRRFAGLEHPAHAGLIFLQSLERPELCFLTLPVQAVRQDYALSLAAEDLELLGWPEDGQPRIGEDVAALAILAIEPDRPPTANLLAPLVLDIATRQAVQAIRPDARYSCQEPLVLEGAAAEPCAALAVAGAAGCL